MMSQHIHTHYMIYRLSSTIFHRSSLISMANSHSQSTTHMAALEDQPVNDIGSEKGPIINESYSNEAATEEDTVIDKEPENTSGAESGNNSATSEEATENPSATHATSTGSRSGLLPLPSELRVCILRHLLLADRPLATDWPSRVYNLFPAILTTCKLIRREAFQIMYGENTFYTSNVHRAPTLLSNPQIRDTIRNVHAAVRLHETAPYRRGSSFIHVIREFGSPAVIRGTLDIILRVDPFQNGMLRWFVRALPCFTNFETVQIEFVDESGQGYAQQLCLQFCDRHKDTFTPVFGPALSFAEGCGLRFRPRVYLNTLPRKVDVDWVDHLDGIRLKWSQDPPTNGEGPEG